MNFNPFFSYIPSIPFYHLIHSSSAITALISGNRGGKTAMAIMDFLLRLFRIHPIAHKNFHDNMSCKTIRFLSETLPSKVEENESSRNTLYPELIKRLPPELIVKDIGSKRPVMVIQDPYSSQHFYIEFASYSQSTQAQAGVERIYVLIDEVPPYSIFEENYSRLISTGGDVIISLTPAQGDVDWIYDMLYTQARHIYRTPAIVNRHKQLNEDKPLYEHHPNNKDITVIHFATDDSPYLYEIYKREASPDQTYDDFISSRFFVLDDEIAVNIRRYGMFSYVSGRVFKEFNPSIHIIDSIRYFPEGLPTNYRYFRTIDYHPTNDWACAWGAVSPTNEVFIYDELKISPETNTLYDIAHLIAKKSSTIHFSCDLIDPLAQIKQITTATSPVEDLNRYFHHFKRQGICKGAYFRSYDTTTTRGRDEIRLRLKNSITCKTPFNNTETSIIQPLPTIWFFSNCKYTIESIRNWSYETWSDRSALLTKDMKEKPQQKFSHFCTALEGAMKERSLTTPYSPITTQQPITNRIEYFRRVA